MRTLAILLSTFLVSTLAHAAPTAPIRSGGGGGGGGTTTGCADKVTGHLNASSTAIDKGDAVTLSWSTSVPAGCTSFLGVHVANVAVANTGSTSVSPQATTTYYLTEITANATTTLSSVTVTVGGVPKYVTMSSGHAVSASDVAQFDALWTQPAQHQDALNAATSMLMNRFAAGVWGTADRMDALVRIYEVTHDPKYLAQLHDFVEAALTYREDRRSDRLPDAFRNNQYVAGWPAKEIDEAGMLRTDEVVSFMYSYPIAAFARIVAEDPSLQATYGADAVRYANAVAQTAWAFMPQMQYRADGAYFQGWLKKLDVFKTLPSESQCDAFYNQVVAANPDASQATRDRWAHQLGSCRNLHKNAGMPMANNENLAFQRMLMELYRTLDSDLYKSSPARSTQGEPLRVLIPVLVARQQRFFMSHVELTGDRYRWHYNDEGSTELSHGWEDTSHASLDMRYLEVLRRDFARLDAASSAQGEPIPFDPATDPVRFAHTFLEEIATGPDGHFADGVDGGTATPIDRRDRDCAGWVSLTAANSAVWSACEGMSLRIVLEGQPYLTIGNHAALLEAKQWLPVVVRRPPADARLAP